jgi:hypothetical protein
MEAIFMFDGREFLGAAVSLRPLQPTAAEEATMIVPFRIPWDP